MRVNGQIDRTGAIHKSIQYFGKSVYMGVFFGEIRIVNDGPVFSSSTLTNGLWRLPVRDPHNCFARPADPFAGACDEYIFHCRFISQIRVMHLVERGKAGIFPGSGAFGSSTVKGSDEHTGLGFWRKSDGVRAGSARIKRPISPPRLSPFL